MSTTCLVKVKVTKYLSHYLAVNGRTLTFVKSKRKLIDLDIIIGVTGYSSVTTGMILIYIVNTHHGCYVFLGWEIDANHSLL